MNQDSAVSRLEKLGSSFKICELRQPINSQILKIELNFSKRLTVESWFIHSQPKVLNRSDGESFPIHLFL